MAIEVSRAFALSNAFGSNRSEERELMQGKNYILASLSIAGEVTILAEMVKPIAKEFFSPLLSTLIPKALTYAGLAGFIALPYLSYCYCTDYFADHSVTPLLVKNILHHTGTLSHVLATAIAITHLYIGSYIYGATMLISLAYNECSHRGLIPLQTRSFFENYINPLSTVLNLVDPSTSYLIKITSLLTILSTFERPTEVLVNMIDRLIHLKPFHIWEYTAAYERKDISKMSYDEITSILKNAENLEINPAHCTHAIYDLKDLNPSRAFEDLLTLFDNLQWNNPNIFLHKLYEDDRFIDFLREQRPGATLNSKETVEKIIDELSNEDPDTYMKAWIRDQLKTLINVLLEKEQSTGSANDLLTAQRYAAIILSYLKDRCDNELEKEDLLIKLAVEGGGYCALGLKRALGEITDSISYQMSDKDLAPDDIFTSNVLRHLQEERNRFVNTMGHHFNKFQRTYILKKLPEKAQAAVTEDVHMASNFLDPFKKIFLPREVNKLSFMDLYFTKFFQRNISSYFTHYKEKLLTSTMDEMKKTGQMWQYLYNKINNSEQLETYQKNLLIERMQDINSDSTKPFTALFFYSLGVLRKRPAIA